MVTLYRIGQVLGWVVLDLFLPSDKTSILTIN